MYFPSHPKQPHLQTKMNVSESTSFSHSSATHAAALTVKDDDAKPCREGIASCKVTLTHPRIALTTHFGPQITPENM